MEDKEQSKRLICVIGCGGIGSFLASSLANLRSNRQLIDKNGSHGVIILYDPDEVEQKNLLYQDFTEDDMFLNKAEVLATRHKVVSMPTRVSRFKNIVQSSEDLIVLCVDNVETRKQLFKECSKGLANPWIDLRCHGRAIAAYARSPKNSLEFMTESLPKEVQEGSDSCQIASDILSRSTQVGNRIVAAIGCQMILNVFRGVPFSTRFEYEF